MTQQIKCSDSQHPHESYTNQLKAVIPVLEEWKQEDLGAHWPTSLLKTASSQVYGKIDFVTKVSQRALKRESGH